MDPQEPITDNRQDLVELRDLEAVTGIPAQRLRYVLDQQLLPQQRSVSWSRGRGRARRFSVGEALAAACAALLLQAGLRRRVVRSCLRIVGDFRVEPRPRGPLPGGAPEAFAVLQYAVADCLEIGDGDCLRIVGGDSHRTDTRLGRWVRISSQAAAEVGYEPLVVLRIDLARLRRLLTRGRF